MCKTTKGSTEMSLAGKVAAVTGAGRGIGRAIALSLADQGASVIVNDRGVAKDGSGAPSSIADEVAAEIRATGRSAVANYASVAEAAGAESIIQSAIDSFGRLDILVNAAGIIRPHAIWEMSDDEWDDVVRVHLYGHFYCTRAAVRQMRAATQAGNQLGGRIVNITSESGIVGQADAPNYSAAKLGVVGLTYSVARACQSFGVTCNAIAPRAITRLSTTTDARLREVAKARGYAAWDATDIEDVRKAFLGGPPEAVAPLVGWLASDEAQDVTGQVLFVTNGRISLYSNMQPTTSAYKDGMFALGEISRIMASFRVTLSAGA